MKFKVGDKVGITSSKYEMEVIEVLDGYYILKSLRDYMGVLRKDEPLTWVESPDMVLLSKPKKNHLPEWL